MELANEVKNVSDYFSYLDWGVIIFYLLLTTFVGHLMKGKQGTIKDFFLGGKSLPWPAVTGSMIATEISGVTFIGVPAMLFYLQGDMTYMIWGIGAILARIIVGVVIVPFYYEKEIYSPYDFMGLRLGNWVKVLTTILFSVGSILAQSVRVMVAALPLMVVTGMDMWLCIVIIGLFAILWTLMGGMRTVIWTDVMQFFLFVGGGAVALIVILMNLPDHVSFWDTANEFNRLKWWDAEFGFESNLKFTFWVSCFAVPFLNLGNYGVDQLNAQRMFCCKTKEDASKAVIVGSIGQLLTLLMLFVGVALFVHYHHTGFTPDELKALQPKGEGLMVDGSNIPQFKEAGALFPVWIVKVLPDGVSGLILAGVFAAAISSLDSILAALSQTTLSLFTNFEKNEFDEEKGKKLLFYSKALVIFWGVLLTGFTILMYAFKTDEIVSLAFGLTAYTVGPLLAILILAILRRGGPTSIITGVVVAFLVSTFNRMELWKILKSLDMDITWLAKLPTYTLQGDAISPTYSFVWLWPVTFFIVFAFGMFETPNLEESEDEVSPVKPQ